MNKAILLAEVRPNILGYFRNDKESLGREFEAQIWP